ncbi:MAG: hypothetical protein KA247_01980 [Bacteroidetes bacterium]|nr:hypothetical protein [Bacteroidota bacterium]
MHGIFIVLTVMTGCRENLPVKEDISDQITVKLRSQYETVSHSRFAGSVRLYVTVVNRTEETLDDIAPISGRFEVKWQVPKDNAPLFDLTRTILISPGNIFYAKHFNGLTKRLSIDPNDSIVLSVVWDLRTNDSTYLLPLFPWTVDQTECHVRMPLETSTVLRRITTPQWFTVKANVKIFDRLSVLYAAPMSIRHCIMIPHNGEVQEPSPPYKKCTDLTLFDPCAVIGQ